MLHFINGWRLCAAHCSNGRVLTIVSVFQRFSISAFQCFGISVITFQKRKFGGIFNEKPSKLFSFLPGVQDMSADINNLWVGGSAGA